MQLSVQPAGLTELNQRVDGARCLPVDQRYWGTVFDDNVPWCDIAVSKHSTVFAEISAEPGTPDGVLRWGKARACIVKLSQEFAYRE